jgi:hypothetical protein
LEKIQQKEALLFESLLIFNFFFSGRFLPTGQSKARIPSDGGYCLLLSPLGGFSSGGP